MSKLVVFGPWVGEFSYEFSWWVPEIRELRNNQYAEYDAFHVGYKGRRGLYKDFIDKYISYPDEVGDTITKSDDAWPDCYFVRGADGDQAGKDMPLAVKGFWETVFEKYAENYEAVVYYTPWDNPIQSDRTMDENPPGEYKNLEVNKAIDDKIRIELNEFEEKRDIVVVMAKSRHKDTEIDREDWAPQRWEQFIDRIINELNLNIAFIGVPKVGNYPGSLDFKGSSMHEKNKKYIKSFVFDDEDSVDYQISLLKNTKCSFYGSSGAAAFPYLTNTPTFTHQRTENSFRLFFEWEKNLTNNHKNICVFDKYPGGQMWFIPVEEMFNEFKDFYESLD